jgi:ABC-type sugar transport system ATPase subunit
VPDAKVDAPSGAEAILETGGLSKEFRGFVAVKRVDLHVTRGMFGELSRLLKRPL